MYSILLTLLIIVAVVMILVILLQKSEGGGMSGSQAASMFGGALTGASAGNFFTKLTAWLATIFFVLCAILAFMVSKYGTNVGGRSDVREALVQGSKPIEPQATPIREVPVLPAEVHEVDDMPEAPEIPEN